MLRRNYDGQESCSVAQALEIIGERWTWLIIRDAFLGLTKFIEFEQSLGIARNVLTDRLNRLVDEGIFARVATERRSYDRSVPRADDQTRRGHTHATCRQEASCPVCWSVASEASGERSTARSWRSRRSRRARRSI